ncbi:MAG: 5'-methylthioadenosine/adenosylhomocysteine nucleosidase [Eubacterium sp.]|nr:5'-methylthioadenosine/adenosylhomocysteine nucleosidase [Eubacterium sp.]
MICIGIVGAMDKEVDCLISEMKDVEEKTLAGMTFHRGVLWDNDTVVVKSGVGKVNIAVCTQLLIDVYEVDMLINTGIAGGLYKGIEVGDIVISSDAVQHDVDVTGRGFKPGEIPYMQTSVFKADPELAAMAKEACEIVNPEIGCYIGRILTGDQFISDDKKRADLVSTFDGYCVEMEGAAMAQVAALNKVPFVIIRAISDKADSKAVVLVEEFEQKAIVHTLKLLAAMFIKMGKKKA